MHNKIKAIILKFNKHSLSPKHICQGQVELTRELTTKIIKYDGVSKSFDNNPRRYPAKTNIKQLARLTR